MYVLVLEIVISISARSALVAARALFFIKNSVNVLQICQWAL